MAAIGELLVYVVFLFLAVGALHFFVLASKTKKVKKLLALLAGAFFCYLLYAYSSYLSESHKNEQLRQVGIYYLTNYPDCENCILELKEDMTYEVRNNGNVIKKSDWHYESGGDYWITYLDNDNHQLGSGDYSYQKYKRKYSE